MIELFAKIAKDCLTMSKISLRYQAKLLLKTAFIRIFREYILRKDADTYQVPC